MNYATVFRIYLCLLLFIFTFMSMISFELGCYIKLLGIEWFINIRDMFFIVTDAKISKSKALADFRQGPASWFTDGMFCCSCYFLCDKKQKISELSFVRGGLPLLWADLPRSAHSQKVLSPNPSCENKVSAYDSSSIVREQFNVIFFPAFFCWDDNVHFCPLFNPLLCYVNWIVYNDQMVFIPGTQVWTWKINFVFLNWLAHALLEFLCLKWWKTFTYSFFTDVLLLFSNFLFAI